MLHPKKGVWTKIQTILRRPLVWVSLAVSSREALETDRHNNVILLLCRCLDSGEFRLSDREIQCRDCTASKKVAYG